MLGVQAAVSHAVTEVMKCTANPESYNPASLPEVVSSAHAIPSLVGKFDDVDDCGIAPAKAGEDSEDTDEFCNVNSEKYTADVDVVEVTNMSPTASTKTQKVLSYQCLKCCHKFRSLGCARFCVYCGSPVSQGESTAQCTNDTVVRNDCTGGRDAGGSSAPDSPPHNSPFVPYQVSPSEYAMTTSNAMYDGMLTPAGVMLVCMPMLPDWGGYVQQPPWVLASGVALDNNYGMPP